MLKKSKRLTRQEFARVFALGKRMHNPFLQVVALPAEDFKVAVVVSKKVHAHAVERNRLRRQLYALLASLGLQKNHYIIIVKPTIAHLPHETVTAGIQDMVGRTPHSR